MTPKMQREDAVSGFSFLFPARYSPAEDAICPAGQLRGVGLDPRLVELQKSPRELGALVPPGSRQMLRLLSSQKSPSALPLYPTHTPPADIWYPGCQTQVDATVPGMPK